MQQPQITLTEVCKQGKQAVAVGIAYNPTAIEEVKNIEPCRWAEKHKFGDTKVLKPLRNTHVSNDNLKTIRNLYDDL